MEYDIHKIADHLYLGDIDSLNYIDKLNISVVISVCKEHELPSAIDSSVTHWIVPISDEDDEPIDEYFYYTHKIIVRTITKGKNVLVHCHKGASRSPAIVIAWYMISKNINYTTAYKFVNGKRRGIRPNDGFIKKLNLLYKYIL